MTFRVVTGDPYQGKTTAEGLAPPKDQASRPGGMAVQHPLTPPPETGPVGQLLDRLEALSFTFEALNANSRSFAAEAVLETLARMERRDLQSLAAIEAFASALKTVSQHLAGLRNAVQTTAHDSAAGIQHISERLIQLEQKTGFTAGAEAGSALDGIAQRLAGIEAKMADQPPIATEFDAGPITDMLNDVVQRVTRIEDKIDQPMEAPAIELDVTPLNDTLETIARQVGAIERKMEPVGDSSAIVASLLALDRRLSRIEASLDPPATSAPPSAAPTAVADEGFASAPVSEPGEPGIAKSTIPLSIPTPAEPVDARPHVDVLLDQVFRVLSR